MPGADQRAVTARSGARLRGLSIRGLSILVLSLGAVAAAAPAAGAVEWIIGGSVSQRLGVDDDDDGGGNGDDGGLSLEATTAVGLDITALTPTTQWQVETGVSGSFSVGSDETEDRNRLNPNFAAAVAHNGKYVDTGASFAFDMQPSSFAQFEETGITEGDATQISIRLAADAAYALDARNSLSIGGSGRVIRFTGGSTTLEPTTTYGTTLSWTRLVSAATQASLSLGARRFTAESLQNPESTTFDLTAGVGHLVNRRLSFDASLGVSATRTTQTVATGDRETEFSLGALGGLSVAWAPAPDTQLVLALSHGLEPSSIGELQTTTALGVGLQHAINSWASAGVDVLVQRQSAGGGFEEEEDDETRTLASISPSLAFSLAPDWALRTGYALALERESGSDEVLNQVFVTLTHQFDILP